MRLNLHVVKSFSVAIACLAVGALGSVGCDDAGAKKAVADSVETVPSAPDSSDVVQGEEVVAEVTVEIIDEVTEEVATGPQPPAPKAYSGGVCPELKEGKNTFMSDGRTRSFELFLPDDPVGAPLLYVYQGQGDSPYNIAYYFGSDEATKERGAIVVSPYPCCSDGDDDCCDMLMVWNYGKFSNQKADVTVFDDVLACLEEQFDIDNSRVYTTGFSAGSLWNSYLTIHRGGYFAAVAIFSGGLGTVITYDAPPAYPMPALLAWGGETDTYAVLSFQEEMLEMSQVFQDNGQFVIECDHGLGHSVPWEAGEWAQEFLFSYSWGSDHNPFLKSGALANFPDYCVIP